ncbi:sialate O-acetylesterase [Verrucomicrobiaceae bacterium 227]
MKTILSILTLASLPALGDLKVPAFFSDGMVLQRNSSAPIWGWADANSPVKVTFAGKDYATKADENGDWKVDLKGLAASDKGSDLVIAADGSTKKIQDVLVGEVWLASGQSNMEWNVSNSDGGKEEIASAKDPLLRVYVSKNVTSEEPAKDFAGTWLPTEPANTARFTAVGYFFAKKLRAEVGVPVGVIECSWGGKSVQAFTSKEALTDLPEAKPLLDQKAKALAGWDAKRAQSNFEKAKAAHAVKLAEWQKTKKGRAPRGPAMATHPALDSRQHSTIFNGMIAPLAGYGVRGAIWYQGESNANSTTARHYEELLGCMVSDWRARWGSEMSFYWVQLANFHQPTDKPGVESAWVTVQDEMRRALESIPSSGMAVINEIGTANNIHPPNKLDVGNRLARWALAKDYGKEGVVISGPLYTGVEKKGDKLVISFDHAKGLKSRDGKDLHRFEIAAEDGSWEWAKAQIEGDKVILTSNKIKNPSKARYAWADNPKGANLVNGEGLPASCFTTE